MKHLIITILFLFVGTGLMGQVSTAEKTKRWHFTGHLGLDVYEVNSSNNGVKGSKLLLAELGYRLHRHFDVGVQLGHQREIWTGFSSINLTVFDAGSFRASWNSRRLNFFIGLQGRLNLRIGQGDLSLSGNYGLNRHSNLVRARNSLPFFTKIRMAPLTNTYHNIHLGYTYWTTPKYGLMIGFSVITLHPGNITRNVEYISGNVPRYIIREWEAEGADTSEDGLFNLRGLLDSSSRHYFTFGLTARIF